MKKVGFVVAAIGALVLVAIPVTQAIAAAKKEPKRLSQGWMEEISKAKLVWKAPAKKKK